MQALAFITAYKVAGKLSQTIDLAKIPSAKPVSFWHDTKNIMKPGLIDEPDMVKKLMNIADKPAQSIKPVIPQRKTVKLTKADKIPEVYDAGASQAIQSLDDVDNSASWMAQNARKVIEENNAHLQGLMDKMKAEPFNPESMIQFKKEVAKRGIQSRQMKNILTMEGLKGG